mmetsp:Transcript_99136/g.318090  ORF Transcript_99136/g.318090 Transcript_99136/m.318090 type:complete len:340 (-) Transcript_99136:922-1941(-)
MLWNLTEGAPHVLEVFHSVRGDLRELHCRQDVRSHAVDGERGTDVAAMCENVLFLQAVHPLLAPLARRLHRQRLLRASRQDLVDDSGDQGGYVVLLRSHLLGGQQVALAVVATEHEVVLGVQCTKFHVGVVLCLSDGLPSAGAHALRRQASPDAILKPTWKQRRRGVHATLGDQGLKQAVAVVLGPIFVEVRAGGDEDEVARRRLAVPVLVQRLEEAQAAGVAHVPWEASVATRGELASAGVQGIVDIAQDLDTVGAADLVPNGLRLRREVREDGLPEPSTCGVRVHELVKVLIASAAVDQVLQRRQLPTLAAEDDAPHGLLAVFVATKASLLHSMDQD